MAKSKREKKRKDTSICICVCVIQKEKRTERWKRTFSVCQNKLCGREDEIKVEMEEEMEECIRGVAKTKLNKIK